MQGSKDGLLVTRGVTERSTQHSQVPSALARDVIGQRTGERPHSLLATLSHQLHEVDGRLGHGKEDKDVL